MRDILLIYVNGKRHEIGGRRAFQTLSDFLRYDLRLVGTKVVCAEGDCGSCTVFIGRPDAGVSPAETLKYRTVTSCIQSLAQLDGAHVVTVEGLSDDGALNAVQEAMFRCQGSQCGFCTPGFVVSMQALFEERKPHDARPLSEAEARAGLVGNLCRCTGYEPILRAAQEVDPSTLRRLDDLYPATDIAADLRAAGRASVTITADDKMLFKPATLAEAVEFKAANPTCTVLAGGTDLGVQVNKGLREPKAVLSLGHLAELHGVEVRDGVLTFGAATSLSAVEAAAREHLPEFGRLLGWFGSPPIRNAGTLGGNIANGSPIGDSMPALYVLNAEIELLGPSGSRRVNINDFYTGYKRTVMQASELIVRVHVPLPKPGETFRLFKVSKRKDLDISTFTAAVWLRRRGAKIEAARVAYGGVGPNILRLPKTEQFLAGREFNEATFREAGAIARGEIAPISDVRGTADYRLTLAENVLLKLLDEPVGGNGHVSVGRVSNPSASANSPPTGRVGNPSYRDAQSSPRAVGRDIPHDSAVGHVTGASVFIDDMPPLAGELHVGVVGSPVAHGRVKAVHLDEAAKVPGVVAIFSHRDVPGHNHFGPVVADDHLLVDGEAEFLGDPAVLIAADTREALAAARRAVRIEMEPLPPIFTIEEAIAADSFFAPPFTIARGDAAAAMAQAEHTLEGVLTIGGQEHFYLESQAAVVVPGEGGTLTVHSSTQHPSEVQAIVAEVCGRALHQVTVITKRMGGGFGGKETQAAQPAAMAALVAAKTGRPARVVYNKDDDMRWTGKRHPFQSRYRVGFDGNGRITALEVDLFSNGGCSTDLSHAVLERAMLHTDNAYYLPNARITGRVCKTNLPSNTAFRGFGGPQGVIGIENIMEEIAVTLGRDPLDVRQANCYGIDERNVTPYGQTIRNNTLPELFEKLRATSDYDRRRREITAANKTSKTVLRGLSMTAVKFGISFTKQFMNQANALVNVYTDGTVLVSTGGTEMGQGINTRVRQLVADEFGIEYDRVLVGATSTDKNCNTSPTAASAGTDLNGAATLDACGRIRARLAEFAAKQLAGGLSPSPDNIAFEGGAVFDSRQPKRRITFNDLVKQAYFARVNLGERGYYATPGIDFNRDTGQGTPFLYYTNGAAASEVAIDRFTGEMKVVRVDLLMDAGVCINPGIDRGQITGGFIQGLGWCTTEELKYAPDGDLHSHSPTTYKIPNIADVPEVFNVALLDNPNNTVSIKRSKALGEPPLLLGISCWTACKNALSYLTAPAPPRLALPATGEELLLAIKLHASVQPAVAAT